VSTDGSEVPELPERYGAPTKTPAEWASKGTGPRQAARICARFRSHLVSPELTYADPVVPDVLGSWQNGHARNTTGGRE